MKIIHNINDISISDLLSKYLYDDIRDDSYYIFNDIDNADAIKHILLTYLNEPERRLIVMYAHTHNYAAIARILNCTPNSVKKYIIKIQQKIITQFNKWYY